MDEKRFLSDDIFESWERINLAGIIHDSISIILANEDFLRLFGYRRAEDVTGRAVGEFISPWPSGRPPRLGRRECVARLSEGHCLDIEAICLPIAACEGTLYQTIVRDITHEKDWQNKMVETERLTAMGKLAGEIAHEINNPLGGILLYANLLKEDIQENSPQRDNIDKIIRLATRCRLIAKDLLHFGRSSSKTYSQVDLNNVIKETIFILEQQRLFQRLEIKLLLDPSLPHFMGDKRQIEQVAVNLIINAAEAIKGKNKGNSPEVNSDGRIVISTSIHKSSKNIPAATKVIRLSIEDNGQGMEHTVLKRIFEPFFTTKSGGEGTGLGLSIIRGIVERHGGYISCKSEPQKGSTFIVELPV